MSSAAHLYPQLPPVRHPLPPPPHTHILTGRALQLWLRDLGLRCGPNPGKELLDALAEAIAAGDTALVQHMQKQATAKQHEISVAGGECSSPWKLLC